LPSAAVVWSTGSARCGPAGAPLAGGAAVAGTPAAVEDSSAEVEVAVGTVASIGAGGAAATFSLSVSFVCNFEMVLFASSTSFFSAALSAWSLVMSSALGPALGSEEA
jgi:hypothetical protein